jgi:ankyrin repeat domain-containing protein 50
MYVDRNSADFACSDLIFAQIDYGSKIEMLEWISPINYGEHHHIVKEARTAGTGEWLLGRQEFSSWQQASSPAVFWLRGDRRYTKFRL